MATATIVSPLLLAGRASASPRQKPPRAIEVPAQWRVGEKVRLALSAGELFDQPVEIGEAGPQKDPRQRIAAARGDQFAVDQDVELTRLRGRLEVGLEAEPALDLGGETRRLAR